MPYKNKDDLKRNKREYYQKNKQVILAKQKSHNALHKDEKSQYDRTYYLDNKEEKLNASKQHYYDNVEKIKEYRKALKGRFSRARSVAKREGREFLLTFDQYVAKTSEPCYYCDDFFPRVQQGIGLDRLNNSIGYTIENVVSCCKNCNQIKMDVLSPAETKAAIEAIIAIRMKNNSQP